MSTTFLVADTHFGHERCCTVFKRKDGTPLRPWTSGEEMDEAMIAAWNSRVGVHDKVYHLGDVVINRRYLSVLDRLNGDKVLIKGNHDIFKLEDYTKYFRDVRGSHVMNGMILTHIPVHEDSLARFGTNIHGHLHDGRVTIKTQRGNTGYVDTAVDPRYHCVSVEHLPDYAPISLDEVFDRIRNEGGTIGFKNSSTVTM